MAIDYNTLVGARNLEYSIKNLANDDRVPSTGILQEAQQYIYQRLRVQQMLTFKTDAPLLVDTDTISLPSDWQYPYMIMFTPTATIAKSIPKHRTLKKVVGSWNYSTGSTRLKVRPRMWAATADNIQFDSVADVEYPTLMIYYAHKALLSPTNLTNFLTDRYLTLLRATCMRYAFEHLQNQKMTLYWAAQAETAINQANTDSDMQLEGMEINVGIDGSPDDANDF